MSVSLHTYEEAAAALRIKESWLRRHIKDLPHTKLGREVLFTDEDLGRISAELFRFEPATGPLAASLRPATGTHPLAHLKPRPSRALRSA
ncbi:helix-turn-helix domain-containing protein [Streptomyces sp. AV19]|uniref:helix-turn-helix domain-containing protein n=1 Tax=Streptomyces sp. AV19 TaxID=2793068 RepID=UPI0018FF0971|nr:helix-turn-helix domain-containing protein [Streptomyces sp. AV19]MBH1932923.1 helix-turn-helix domain-containing protein [Streptomyces sp. AV19]MDG4531673.1 helix-turn-helix domain-containing protein [Streptomyces sp. AV19]